MKKVLFLLACALTLSGFAFAQGNAQPPPPDSTASKAKPAFDIGEEFDVLLGQFKKTLHDLGDEVEKMEKGGLKDNYKKAKSKVTNPSSNFRNSLRDAKDAINRAFDNLTGEGG